MNRRNFVTGIGAGFAAFVMGGVSFAQSDAPEVALTFDDPQVDGYPGYSGEEVDARLRGALRDLGVKAVLFVCGTRVDNASGKKLLQAWNDERHVLANHSFSHLYFHSGKVSLAQFKADAQTGEDVVRGFRVFKGSSVIRSSKRETPSRSGTACAGGCARQGIWLVERRSTLPTGRLTAECASGWKRMQRQTSIHTEISILTTSGRVRSTTIRWRRGFGRNQSGTTSYCITVC